MKESVNHPSHYNQGKIEVIDAIEEWGLNFCEGNVVKYVARHRHKGEPIEDLRKAMWYLERLISNLNKKYADMGMCPEGHDLKISPCVSYKCEKISEEDNEDR